MSELSGLGDPVGSGHTDDDVDIPERARPADGDRGHDRRRAPMIRSAVIFVVAGLLAAGVLYERIEPTRPAVETSETASVVTPSVSDPARLDGAWFCPVGSSVQGGFADHELRISNLGDESAVANVSILTGEGRGPTLRLDLAPLSSQELALSSIAQTEFAGAVVEIVGGTGVVGHRVTTAQGTAEGACATHVSSEWFFAAGRTQRDSLEYLALMNPFPEDVVYNVELYRSAGRPRQPGALQGGTVPANSVRIIELSQHVPREEVVAAAITTVRGRLVVERLQVLNGDLGPRGAALQLGVPGPADSWILPAGRIHPAGDDRAIVFNPSAEDTASVEIELWPVNPTDRSRYGLGVIPRELLPGRFEIIDLRTEADRFGLRLPFEVGVSVRSVNGVPIVAERWHFATEVDRSLIGAGGTEATSTDDGGEPVDADGDGVPDEPVDADGDGVPDEPVDADGDGVPDEPVDADGDGVPDEPADAVGEDGGQQPVDGTEPGELDVPGLLGGEAADLAQPTPTLGIATSRGVEVLADRWLVPWVSTSGPDSSVVIVAAPEEVSVEAFILANGELLGPWRATIPPDGRAIVPIEAAGVSGPVLVTADAPVSVEAQVVSAAGELSIVPGIPTVRRR